MAKERSGRKRVELLVNHLRILGPKVPLSVRVDPTHTVLYVRVSKNATTRTIEVDTEVLADYDKDGDLVGFEIIGFESPQRTARVPARVAGSKARVVAASENYDLEAALV